MCDSGRSGGVSIQRGEGPRECQATATQIRGVGRIQCQIHTTSNELRGRQGNDRGCGIGRVCTVTHWRGVEARPPDTATTTPARSTRVETGTATGHTLLLATVAEGDNKATPAAGDPSATVSTVGADQ